jgi:hypothetical protein
MRLEHLQTFAKLRHENMSDEEKAALRETLEAVPMRHFEICCWPGCAKRQRHHFWAQGIPCDSWSSVTVQFCDEHEGDWVSLVQSLGGCVQKKDENENETLRKSAGAELEKLLMGKPADDGALLGLIGLINDANGFNDGICDHAECHGLLMPAAGMIHCEMGGSCYHLPLCADHIKGLEPCDCPDRPTMAPPVDLAGPEVLELRRRRRGGEIVWMR